jgi:hypothetical protein
LREVLCEAQDRHGGWEAQSDAGSCFRLSSPQRRGQLLSPFLFSDEESCFRFFLFTFLLQRRGESRRFSSLARATAFFLFPHWRRGELLSLFFMSDESSCFCLFKGGKLYLQFILGSPV